MQLDQTHVTIRARSLTEICDLATAMIRCYPVAVIVGFVAGAVPWAIANSLLLGSIPLEEFRIGAFDEDMDLNLSRYQIFMAMLVFLQTPAAGALTTLYIGQAVFESRPTWASVAAEVRKLAPRWLWELGVVRGPVILMAVIAVTSGPNVSYEIDYFWPVVIVLLYLLVRSIRPFMPEILLLERCPLRSPKASPVITASRRSAALHKPIAGELFGRYIAISIAMVAIAGLSFYSLLWLRGVLFGLWEWDLWVYLVLYPVALWSAAAFSVIVRFLSYLDTRIRLEGWEVQLSVLAETIRQFGEEEKVTTLPDAVLPTTTVPARQLENVP